MNSLVHNTLYINILHNYMYSEALSFDILLPHLFIYFRDDSFHLVAYEPEIRNYCFLLKVVVQT